MILKGRAEIEAFARRPQPELRAALIHGQDRTRVRELGARVLSAVAARPDDPFDVAELGSTEIDPERLAAELSALSLMGGRRVVHVRVTGELGPREKVLAEALGEHVEGRYGPDAFLLIEAGALTARSLLRKAAEGAREAAAVALYEEEAADLGRMAKETLERDGLRLTPPVLARLAERLPRDRGAARQGLEVLALYVGPGSGRAVSEADVDAALGDGSGSAAAEIALSAFSGRMAETAAALRRARFLGEAGPMIVRQLSLHLNRLNRAQAAIAGGAPPQTALRNAGVFWKQERDVIAQLSRWPPEALEALQVSLLAADMVCKTAGSPDELIAHNAAFAIAEQASRRA